MLRLTRYITLLGVVASLCVAFILFIAVFIHLGVLAVEAAHSLGDLEALKLLGIESIEIVDLCLIATALYIVSFGLYTLFIGPVELPSHFQVRSLDDLKEKLVSIVVVVLGVSFLGQVADWDGVRNLLPFGVAVAAVIVALSIYGLIQRSSDHSARRPWA